MSRQTLAQRVAEDIYNSIIEGKSFAPGDRLPGELILSEELGVSRTTLREAIKLLAAQGLLEVHRGKGTFISEDAALFDPYGLDLLNQKRMRLKDLIEARLIVEPQIAALAAERATSAELEQILDCEARVRRLIEEGADRTDADQAFHQAILNAAHNDFMKRILPVINSSISEMIASRVGSDELAETTLQGHALVAEFLKAHDPEGSRQAMAIHLKHAYRIMGFDAIKRED